MIIVKEHRESTCLWCGALREGVQVEMQDGSLKGFLCKSDFWTLVKKRGVNGKPPGKATATPPSK